MADSLRNKPPTLEEMRALFGCMEGTVLGLGGFDLTAPIFETLQAALADDEVIAAITN